MTRKIKVVICSWSPSLAAGSGRMEAYTVRHLDRSQFDPVLVSMRAADHSAHAHDAETGVRFVGNRDRLAGLMELFADADIVQFQGGFDPLVCEAARQCEVPILVETIHNLERGGVFPEIDRVVCVSNAVAALQRNDPRVVVIPNGIDLALFPFPEQPDTNRRIIFLEAARREKPMRHIDVFADELLALDPRIELWLAGAGQTLPSTDRIKYLGFQRDTAALFRQATISFLLTYEEAFGLVAAESMASGTPTVVSSLGALPEVVVDGESGWIVDAADTARILEVARGILDQIGTPALERVRRAGRARVEEQFTIERAIGRYQALYLELAEQKGLRRTPVRRDPVRTPEAEIGEAMFAYHERHNFLVVSAFERLVERNNPLRFAESFAAAELLVRLLPLETLAELFSKSCAWLQSHGRPLRYEVVQLWLKAIAQTGTPGAIIPSLLHLAPSAPELLLEGVALALEQREPSVARELLQGGIERTPAGDIHELYREWLSKLQGIPR